MVYHLRRTLIAVVFFGLSYIALSALHSHLDPNTSKSEEEREDNVWIATSKYWVDRQACRYLGLCGVAHYRPDPAMRPWNRRVKDIKDQIFLSGEDIHSEYFDWEDISDDDRNSPDAWEGDPRVLKDVPQFVLDHAPLIHLYSGEQFWPSDINEHLMYTTPYVNHTTMNMTNEQHTLYNLKRLNQKAKGKYSFMASKEDVEDRPEWLGSPYNKPVPYEDDDDEEDELVEYEFSEASDPKDEDVEWWDPYRYAEEHKIALPLKPQELPKADLKIDLRRKRETGPSSRKAKASNLGPTMPKQGGYSPAPAILVMVDKGNGILDAFWFYFYSYNLGTTVLNIRFGNHVGDWEHSLIRFKDGVPKAVFFSAHSGGLAYSYNAVEKGKGKGRDGRPVLYSALGSHAMYASPGSHPYVLPFGLLADVTDRGPLWDPALNYMAYHFNTSITHNADAHSISASGSHWSPTSPLSPSLSSPEYHTLSPSELESSFQPASCNPKAPLSWWWYNGHWGDKFYDLGDRRQWRFAGQYHYVNGPLGPRYKNLGRSRLCQSRGPCRIVESLREGKKKSWLGT